MVAAARAFWAFVRTDRAMVGAFRSWNMHPLFCFTTNPVDLSASEAYDAFNRGVVDGISLSVTSMKDYAFYE